MPSPPHTCSAASSVHAAGNTDEPAEQLPFDIRQQLVTPVHGRLERPLPCDGRSRAAGEQAESVLQPRLDLLRRQDDDAGGRQLDGERNPIETPADTGDGVRVVRGRCEGGVNGARTLDEELCGLGVDERVDGTDASASGSDNEGTRQTVSPDTPSASRLVARIRNAGAPRSRASTSSAQAAIRCSQLSSTSRSSRSRSVVEQGVADRSLRALSDTKSGRDRLRHQIGHRERRQIDQPHAVGKFVHEAARQPHRQPRLSNARRRPSATAAAMTRAPRATRASSFRRPTKLVSSAGRL